MKFIDFFKDKVFNILMIIFALITIQIFLSIYNFGILVKVYIVVSILTAYFIGIIIEFYSKSSFYKQIQNNLEELDQKYLIPELIENVDFLEGKILKEIIQETNKSMYENVNNYKYMQEEYKEYIELWIHEIKIPIATAKLIIENNKNEVTNNIDEEIDEIDNYIEQALFYARSNNVEKDYVIRKSSLEDIVNSVISKNKKQLISKKIRLDIIDTKKEIFVDSKWIKFILNQIVVNSIKYLDKQEKYIKIVSKEQKDKVILYIKDNGIGINESEISRVFEKGFTGTNGRKDSKKSTGIGLYLSKKLCDKLGVGIKINSIEKEGTEVRLIFPKSSYSNF